MRPVTNWRRGFTLIELMVVLAVVAILIAVAYPSFLSFLIRADRGDAREALAAVELVQERYRSRNGTYADNTALAGENLPGDPGRSPRDLYVISITQSGRDGYTATATARAETRQTRDRAACQVLTLAVTPSGALRTPEECW
jgi:type IV pilus assembly protein PilE